MDEKDALKKLQFFLIKKFMLTLLFVSFAEYGISVILRRFILPFVMLYFFNGSISESIGAAGVISVVIAVTFGLVLSLLGSLLPGRGQQFVIGALGIIARRLELKDANGNAADPMLWHMSPAKTALLLLLLAVMLFLIAAPFFLGGVYYAGVVIRQFGKIEKARIEKQREYERKRNLMLSDIAHDLRTPITTVSGYARALSDNMVSDVRKQEYLDAIIAKSARMNELITYLFDYVKTDSEGFELKKERTDVCELVRECAALLYQDMEDAKMRPVVEIPEEPFFIEADRLQFSRTVTNLLTNAIRHNRENTSIGIVMLVSEDRADICIADNGIKIEPALAEHIFEPFVMGDESRSSKAGTGLGLSIAHRIMKLHGFDLSLIQQPAINNSGILSGYVKAFVISVRAS